MDDGRMLAESKAILCFLADGSPLFPDNRWQRAQILQWLFFEHYSHEPNIATVRYWVGYLGKRDEWADKIPDRSEEHTSEIQSLMRTTYAFLCSKKPTHPQYQIK